MKATKHLFILVLIFTLAGCSKNDDGNSKSFEEIQYEAMVAFKNANPDTNTYTWDPNETDLSQWSGLTVDENGHIVSIKLIGPLGDLDTVYFEAIPPEISDLEYLEELIMPFNNLTSIPEEISELENLTQIDLQYNNLTTIPKSVCDMEAQFGTSIKVDEGVTCE